MLLHGVAWYFLLVLLCLYFVEIVSELESSFTSTTFSLCTRKVFVTMGFVKINDTFHYPTRNGWTIRLRIQHTKLYAYKLIKWEIMSTDFPIIFSTKFTIRFDMTCHATSYVSSHARRMRETTKCLLSVDGAIYGSIEYAFHMKC